MTHDPTTREGREELRRLLTGEVPIYEWRSRAAQALAATSAMLDALDAKDAEIAMLEAERHPCDGCGLPELHKMCPAYGTDAYLNKQHPAWGDTYGIIQLKLSAKDAEIARLNDKLAKLRDGIAGMHADHRTCAKLADLLKESQ